MRESSIVAAIKVKLLKAGWFVFKIHGGVMQIAGMPDLLCLRDGVYVWIEVKTPDGRLTNRQKFVHDFLRGKGADVRVMRSAEELGDMLCTASSTISTPSGSMKNQDSASSSAPSSTES